MPTNARNGWFGHIGNARRRIGCCARTCDGDLGSGIGIFSFAEDGDDVFDGNNEEFVVALEIDRDSVLGVKEDAVVAFDWVFAFFFDESGDGDDSACDGGDFDFVGEVDTEFGLLFVVVLADEDALAQGLDDFEGWGLAAF